MQNRRKFIQGCSVTAAVASTAPVAAIAESAANSAGTRCISAVSPSSFADLLNQSFRVRGEAGGMKVTLVESAEPTIIKDNDSGARFESYDLVFSTPKGKELPAGDYTLEHSRLGSIKAHLVPWHSTASNEGTPSVVTISRAA
jgi:hypothetical protein